MKNALRVLIVFFIMIVTLTTLTFAGSGDYIMTKELTYESNRKNKLSSGFVEVLIGNMNFVQYQRDNEIVVTPKPDEINEDEYGNMYAYYDLTGLGPKEKFKIIIKRDCSIIPYTELVASRTESVINDETEIYLEERENIESEDIEIIAKAKEVTDGMTTDYKRAEAIFEYVNVNMSYDTSTTYANKGSLSALENMRGVCEEFATLFVAMCRAVQIPSRVIEGYKLQDVESGDEVVGKELIDHVWAEIYLEGYGWLPVEPTVMYTVNGERKPYLQTFCNLNSYDYIAIGVYNYEKANRRMKSVIESSYIETYVEKDSVLADRINSFEDISEYDWAIDAIQSLYAKRIIEGYSESEFGPENNITRIEFICMLSRLLNYYETRSENSKGMVYYYPDYDEEHWSKEEYDYLLRCYQVLLPDDLSAMGYTAITNVFGTGKIDMNKPITRAEAVALMDLFLEDELDYSIKFSDIGSTKFKSSIVKAYSNGLLLGYPDGTFKPNNLITRAEMSVILGRYIDARIYVL